MPRGETRFSAMQLEPEKAIRPKRQAVRSRADLWELEMAPRGRGDGARIARGRVDRRLAAIDANQMSAMMGRALTYLPNVFVAVIL